MAPKKQGYFPPGFRPGGDNTTLLEGVAGNLRPQANFSTYVATFYPTDFVQMLADGRQVEQLWRPGTLHPMHFPPGEQLTLEGILQTLFPGREHPGLYTPPEQIYLAATTFQWLFTAMLMSVPATLPPNIFANFMLYVTLPLAMFQQKMQTLMGGGALHFSGADAFWGDDLHLNFSFSPRSAVLLFAFGLSIKKMACTTFQVGQLVTLGSGRPNNFGCSWCPLTPSGTGVIWITFSLCREKDPLLWTTFLKKAAACFRESPWWRLFHLPVNRQLWDATTQSQTWDFIPRELWQAMARPRL
ncbi:unnamed protein product [Symbiodinium sp. CCMP2592]|nr:unnamed protein product [Symbiodinium sp. CCMP2592]